MREKGEQFLKAGITPETVLPKILFPLLEGVSFEDNEGLHMIWAALLANVASPENAGKVRPGLIAILKQMAPDEAALLKTTAELLDGQIVLMDRLRERFVKLDGEEESATEIRLQTCVQILETAGLVEGGRHMIMLNDLGKTFLETCRPPKPKS